jgi:hypothetical protein
MEYEYEYSLNTGMLLVPVRWLETTYPHSNTNTNDKIFNEIPQLGLNSTYVISYVILVLNM